MTDRDLLIRLGRGDSITAVCAAAGITRAKFDARWHETCRRRVPPASGASPIPKAHGLVETVRIERDAWGIPHVYATNDADLFFGFGYATASIKAFIPAV